MLNLGTIKPGSTIRIPFSSFDKDDGSSITMTNFAVADILIYKDGNTTARASTSGFTATTDFNGKTGKHLAIIDLSDNTTADFYAAGSEYLVAIDAVTIDGVTTGGWIARFCIGYPDANLDTTLASLSTQTSFTLTVGPAEDDALNGHWSVIHDAASAIQRATVLILDYTGSTKTVTLAAAPTFTIAAKDNISVMDLAPLQPTTLGAKLDVTATGEAGIDWANVGAPTTTLNLSGTTIKTATDIATATTAIQADTDDIQTRLPAALVGGRIDASVGAMASGVVTSTAIAADAIGASELAADAAAEIASAVRAELTTELGRVDVAVSTRLATAGYTAPLDAAGTRSAVGLASANLDTQLGAIAGFIDTEVSAIKAQTDQLVFTVANQVDVNVVDWKGATAPAMTGDAFARLGAPAGASVSADIAAVKVDTADVKAVTDKVDTLLEATSDGYHLSANAIDEIPDAVWREPIANHSGVSGSTAEALAAAGSAGDPWTTALPGGYSAGQAGFIVGTNLNATVSSRATQTSVDTIDDFVDTEVAAIKAVTDKIDNTLENTSDGWIFTVNALQNAPTGGSAPTASQIADEVQTRTIAAVTTVGTVNALATNSVTAAALAADAGSEIAAAVWAAGTRALTELDEDNTTIDLDASVRAAVGMSAANLDTQLSTIAGYVDTEVSAIKAVTDLLGTMIENTTDGWIWTVAALQQAPTDGASPTVGAIADAVLDEVVDGSYTLRQSVRIQNAVAAGKSSGHDLLTPVFRDLADTKDRIDGAIDEFGNRTAVTIDAS